jgi:hypothetical protein
MLTESLTKAKSIARATFAQVARAIAKAQSVGEVLATFAALLAKK